MFPSSLNLWSQQPLVSQPWEDLLYVEWKSSVKACFLNGAPITNKHNSWPKSLANCQPLARPPHVGLFIHATPEDMQTELHTDPHSATKKKNREEIQFLNKILMLSFWNTLNIQSLFFTAYFSFKSKWKAFVFHTQSFSLAGRRELVLDHRCQLANPLWTKIKGKVDTSHT